MAEGNKKKRVNWREAAEIDLLQLWQDKMPQLRSARKNMHIFQEISRAMISIGHIYTANEIKIKVHNFTNKYRQEKQKIGPSGGSPSEWRHYEAVHQAIGGYKSFCSAEFVEDSIAVDMEPIYLDIEEEPQFPSPDPSSSESSLRPTSTDSAKKKKKQQSQ